MAGKTENGQQRTKVITNEVRLSYAYLFQPRAAGDDGGDAKYSAKLIIPKSDKETYRKLRAAQVEAITLGEQGKFNGKKIKRGSDGKPVWGGSWDTIKDGDEDSDAPEDEGAWVVNVSSKNRPGIVDRKLNEIIDSTEVYSGCYARVSLNCYPYNFNGKIGVTFGLNHVQKLRDGDPLGGRSRASDDFDELDDEYDDDEDDDIL